MHIIEKVTLPECVPSLVTQIMEVIDVVDLYAVTCKADG